MTMPQQDSRLRGNDKP